MYALFMAVLFTQDVTPLPPKQSTPLPAAQTKAEKLIKDLYHEDYARSRKSPADMLTLAGKLLAQAKETKDDVAARFVALREARDLAAKAGDIPTLNEVIGEIDKLYKVNATDMRIVALELAGRSATTREGTQAIVTAFFALAEELLASDNYGDVHKALRAAENVAIKARAAALAKTIQSQIRSTYEMEDQYGQVKKAKKKLDKDGDDPDANLIVGKYTCFIKGDWEAGLVMLSRCNDAKLKDLAKHDSEVPDEVKGQVEVGDGWWDLSIAEKNIRAKKQLQSRACIWYKEALVKADGLTKTKIEKRIAEMMDGEKKIYLSDLQEIETSLHPGHPLGKNGDLGWVSVGNDKKVSLRGTEYKKSLSTHGQNGKSTYVTYDIEGKYTLFSVTVGINDSVNNKLDGGKSKNPVIFSVVGDGKVIWKSKPLQRSGASQNCEVNITGVKKFELRVSVLGDYIGSHAIWADPYVK